MAKKAKFDFNSFVQELKDTAISKSVDLDSKIERRYYLIVCEGEKTEPIYFEYFQKRLPKNIIKTIEVKGEGDNTINIIKKCIELNEERKQNKILPNYDRVWAVFDKDDFPDKNFNRAVSLANEKNILTAYSNQSFELWYVLHFQYLLSCIDRKDYINILTDQIGFKYEKNDEKVVKILFEKGNVRQAIKWAKELDEYHIENNTSPSKSCPLTKVYELVEELLEYCKIDIN